jgi:hypothetical protein
VGALGSIAAGLNRNGKNLRQKPLGALRSARGGKGKIIDNRIKNCIISTRAPKNAAPITETTEYLSRAEKEANGFQAPAVQSKRTVNRINKVHLAQVFIVFLSVTS